jgi:hypothetical protein
MTYGKSWIALVELREYQLTNGNAYVSGVLGHVSMSLLRDGERPHSIQPGEVVTV